MIIEGTSALVAGGASGLGEAAARAFAARGAKVTIMDIDSARGTAVANDIGGSFVEADMTNTHSLRNAVSKTCADSGCPRLLVNAAGIAPPFRRYVGRSGSYDENTFRRTIDVNLTGTFMLGTIVAEQMKNLSPEELGERGVIVNVSSINAYDAPLGTSAYTAAKAGVAGMTLALARDLSPYGIRVCAIAPGAFETPMMTQNTSPEERQAIASLTPFPSGQLGEPRYFADLVLHVCENLMLNGEVIRLDGASRLAQH